MKDREREQINKLRFGNGETGVDKYTAAVLYKNSMFRTDYSDTKRQNYL